MVDGRLQSLPIPAQDRSATTYEDLGLGALVERQTGGRISGGQLCHADPAFQDGKCAFGQTGAAQTHLHNQGVGVGSVFLFFGLFRNAAARQRQHWLFGYLRVKWVVHLGSAPCRAQSPRWLRYAHPHAIGAWNPNNRLYLGEGCTAQRAHESLRLTAPEGHLCRWRIPRWLRACGLSYHQREDRWREAGHLRAAARGQEFVCDIGGSAQARRWLAQVIRQMQR